MDETNDHSSGVFNYHLFLYILYRLPGNPSIDKSCSSVGHGDDETDSDRKGKIKLEIGGAILVWIISTVLGVLLPLQEEEEEEEEKKQVNPSKTCTTMKLPQ